MGSQKTTIRNMRRIKKFNDIKVGNWLIWILREETCWFDNVIFKSDKEFWVTSRAFFDDDDKEFGELGDEKESKMNPEEFEKALNEWKIYKLNKKETEEHKNKLLVGVL